MLLAAPFIGARCWRYPTATQFVSPSSLSWMSLNLRSSNLWITQGMVVWFFTCLLFSYFLCFAILIRFPSLGIVSFCVFYTKSLWISEFEKASVQILYVLYTSSCRHGLILEKSHYGFLYLVGKKWIKIYDPYYACFPFLCFSIGSLFMFKLRWLVGLFFLHNLWNVNVWKNVQYELIMHSALAIGHW
jgi:hypothetical protein